MYHTSKVIRLSAKSLLLSLGLTLVACGGGGGGDGGSTYPSITYSGATGAATVNSTNAADFPVVILDGSTRSAEANPYAAIIDNTATQEAQHAAMLNILAEQITNDILNQQNTSDNNIVAAATSTLTGTCPSNPGSITSIDNSSPPNINIVSTYDNFCVGDINTSGIEIVTHGKMNISGNFSINPTIINSITATVEYLKMTVRTNTGTSSEEFSGSFTVTFDGTSANIVTGMTVSTNFEANGLTFKIENLVVDTSSGLNISGRFYHPLHGYVDVTTPAPFTTLVSTNPDKYCNGSLRITGSGGVIDFTADASCSTYDLCFTPTGGSQSCTTNIIWP